MLNDCMLVCATETKTEQDLKNYTEALQAAMQTQRDAMASR